PAQSEHAGRLRGGPSRIGLLKRHGLEARTAETIAGQARICYIELVTSRRAIFAFFAISTIAESIMRVRCFIAALLFLSLTGVAPAQSPRKIIDFNRAIRPILSNNCFVCHGPDNNLRKADLRLDQEKGLYDDRDGYRIIVPGKPQESELFRRITT